MDPLTKGGTIVPPFTEGKEKKMSGAFRFGIMGAGNIAVQFCDAVRHVQGAQVAAVACKDPARAAAFVEKNGIQETCSYEALVRRSDIDAVYIATTHNFHYENLKLCLSHGKHVLCEKSMVESSARAREICALAEKNRLFLMEALWSRFLPHINRAKAWIEEGKIGTPQMGYMDIGFRAAPDMENRINNPSLGGGAALDLSVYPISIMSYLLGDRIDAFQAMASHLDNGVDKVNNIAMRIGGCIVNAQAITTAKLPEAAYIYGTEGYIKIPEAHRSDECTLFREGEAPLTFKAPYENGFVGEIEETIRCVRAGKLESSVMPHASTIRCAEIFDQIFDRG